MSIVTTSFVQATAHVAGGALVAGALLLTWLARRRAHRGPGSARDAPGAGGLRGRLTRLLPRTRLRALAGLLGSLLVVLLVQGLVAVAFAARLNASMQFALTAGDVWSIVSSGRDSSEPAVLSPRPASPASSNPVVPGPSAATQSTDADKVTFTPAANGFVKATVTGARSGVTGDIWAWLPPGYNAQTASRYKVVEFLHGAPGAPDGVVKTFDPVRNYADKMLRGEIAPAVLVAPSLNAEGRQLTEPDCADFVGHAQMETWTTRDVPAIVAASLGTSTSRQDWAIAGLSSGGYCALWSGIMHSQTYSTVLAMSAYDVPSLGGLGSSADLRRRNTLTTLIAEHPHNPLRIWVMGASDDVEAGDLATRLPLVAPHTDLVTGSVPRSGGHSWSLWSSQMPVALAWWHQGGGSPGGDGKDVDATTGSNVDPPSFRERALKTLTGIQGPGLMTGVCLLAGGLGLLAVSRWRRRGREAYGARFSHRGVRAGAFALEALLRGMVLAASGVAAALALGLLANRDGNFYTTWAVAWGELAPILYQ
ncbi:esterase family protein [uncultured Actinomyces sp.]|uniref:alpha/beta hydrolase n=1 Tax=uncultured Actinomyces sp. TaxID=249061 RepID=UPI00262E0620|nr:alpha/beta hydrolase-fold protein [uncultured Actinomyces sp.]